MRIRIVAVGKIKDKGLRALIADYYGRIGRFAKIEETELKDGAESDVAERFVRAIPDRARVVALEAEGKPLSSDGLAAFVARAQNDSMQSLVFLIGGSYGLPPEVVARADARLSLSAMTFPHRLCRLFLAEQVYRAFTILADEPYSH